MNHMERYFKKDVKILKVQEKSPLDQFFIVDESILLCDYCGLFEQGKISRSVLDFYITFLIYGPISASFIINCLQVVIFGLQVPVSETQILLSYIHTINPAWPEFSN